MNIILTLVIIGLAVYVLYLRRKLKTAQVRIMESGRKSAVAALSAGILHQVSQPITAIHGFVRFMKKEMSKDDILYKPVALMDEQATYLKGMLENLMDLVRHRVIRKEPVDLNAVVEKSMNLLGDELRMRRIGWDMVLDRNLPPVHADAIHLQQVFMNLAINAKDALSTKATGQPRTLDVSTQWDRDKGRAVVCFKNNGPAISIEAQERIFDPFFTTKDSGTGIGLALCCDLVAEHNGTIDVSSNEETTIFTIALPCLPEEFSR